MAAPPVSQVEDAAATVRLALLFAPAADRWAERFDAWLQGR